MRESPFIALLVVSGLLHLAGVGGALGVLAFEVPQPAQKASIRIALGSSGRAAGAMARPRQATAQAWETPKTDTRAVEPEQQQVRRIRIPPPEPEPILEEVLQPVVRTVEPPQQMRSTIEQQGQYGLSGRDGRSKTDTDGETDDEGYESLLAQHDALVLGHLSQFKAYPARARMRDEQGAVAVEFQIDRMGALLRSRILLTSDFRSLDSAALRQMRDAEPYPEAPADVRWERRTYRTEMRYRLR